MSTVHIIVNSVAGHGKSPEFVNTHVVNLLTSLQVPYEIHTTASPKDAGRIGVQILKKSDDLAGIRVIVAGGDGTAHELIEGVLQSAEGGDSVGRWELAILPLGTANALHASLFPPSEEEMELLPSIKAALGSASRADLHALVSVFALLSNATPPRRLSITRTNLLDKASHPVSPPITSHIVLSTSLHAALLSDSEALRGTHPGLERFKLAAEKNMPIAFGANATLRGPVLQYSPREKAFVDPFTVSADTDCRIDGPFSYFLSVTTADRLEPTFVIAPTLKTLPPDPATQTMDVVVLRPSRDPLVQMATGEEAKAEARGKRLGEAMGWAYQQGRHVDMTYLTDGSGKTEEAGHGDGVCEVFRCAGFDWSPEDGAHEKSRLICGDGSIHVVPNRGKAEVRLLDSFANANDGFHVYV